MSVAENIFTNHLRSNIAAVGIPGFDAERAIKTGAVELRNLVPAKYLTSVLVAYNDAITKAFQLAVIMACLASLGAVGMERRNMKTKPTASNDEEQTEKAQSQEIQEKQHTILNDVFDDFVV